MAESAFERISRNIPPETRQFVDKNCAISRQVRHILEHHETIKSQKDLAKALGKKPSEISKWLCGLHNIGLENITKMEAVLGTDIIITPEDSRKKYLREEPMTSQPKLDVEMINYITMRELAFSYHVPEGTEPVDGDKPFQHNLEIAKKVDKSEGSVQVIIILDLKKEVSKKREITGKYATEHIFKVENFKDFITEKKGHVEMDQDLDFTLTGLAYSTVRGLCYQKFYGTRFSSFILPINKPGNLTEK